MENKKVTVIMGVYNSDKDKLKRAINSILKQSYENIEFIICNDASTNGTGEFLDSITDDRVVVIKNEENRGLAYSLNQCLENANGEYIARMDDDDISEVTRIEKQVKFLNENPAISVVGTAVWLIDEDNIWGEDYMKEYPQKEDLLYGVVHAHPSIMVRREAYKVVNGYRVLRKTERTEDYDLYLRLYAAGIKGYNIQEKLFYYTQSTDTFTKRRFRHRLDEVACRFEGFKNLKLYPKGYVYLLKPIISGLIPNKVKQYRLKKKLQLKE